MKNKILTTILLAFIVVGCSKIPDPVELDGKSAITINQELIKKERHRIPLDPFLKKHNWTYNLEFEKSNDGEYIPNDMVVKTFFVAHNADRIVIIGNKQIANEYKNFLATNGCEIKNIAIQPVDMIGLSKKRVNILFFGMKGEEDESYIKTFTSLFNF